MVEATLMLLLALGTGAGAGAGAPWHAAAQDPSTDADAQGVREVVVRVDDARIRALCTRGRPEVLILHGEGESSEAWRPVLERLDGRVGACAYDRRGSGGSADAPESRGWYELLDELRRIHLALDARPPYVLAGHSLGGLYARVYASDRPDDVAGLVLVDPAHEDMPDRVRTGMPADAWKEWMERRARPNADGVVEGRVAERARGSRLQRMPVTVVTATVRRNGEGWDARFLGEAARQVHASIVRGLSQGRHVPADGSGHAVHRQDPELVVGEIARVVRALRWWDALRERRRRSRPLAFGGPRDDAQPSSRLAGHN